MLPRFSTTQEYKVQFEQAVDEIIDASIEDRSERMRAVEGLTDEYVIATGERPDPTQLERLTDYILREELTDKTKNKAQTNQYPFFSSWQLEERHNEERSIKHAEEYGSDGRNYKTPSRRRRNTYENIVMDRNTKSRNAERRKKYRMATKPGKVTVYLLE